MEVKFARTAFIGGVRYKAGVQLYGGPVEDLPDDATVDGVKVGDMDERKLAKAKKTSDKADFKTANSPAVPSVPFDEAAFRKQVEDDLRPKLTDEVRNDPAVIDGLKEELRQDSKFRAEFEDKLRVELKQDTAFRKEILDEELAKQVTATPPSSTPLADPFAAPTPPAKAK